MDNYKKIIRSVFWAAVGCILLYWLLHETSRVKMFIDKAVDVISPFIAGAAVAFVLNVPMRAVEKLFKGVKNEKSRRALSILATFVVLALVLVGVYFMLVPQLVSTVESLIATLPGFISRTQEYLTNYFAEHPDTWEMISQVMNVEAIDFSGLIQKAVEWIGNSLTTILNTALNTVINLSTGIFNGILSLVFALYCLSKKEILARQARRILYSILPEKASDEAIRIGRMLNSAFSNFISGQCLEALILGCMFAISMSIFRMPFMPLVSVVIAITALVPIVGAFVGCAVGAFFILVQDPTLALWFVVMFLVLQQIEGNMIYPKVVGKSIGLPGMWVLVAVAVGGNLMGVGGMLIMIPLAAVMYTLAREYTNKRLAEKGIPEEKLQDQPPELGSRLKAKGHKIKAWIRSKKTVKVNNKENKS